MSKQADQKHNEPTQAMITAYQLRKTGWSIAQVAQQLGVSESTVFRYDKEVENRLGTLPSTQLARDHLQSLVPRCVDVFESALHGKDKRLATEIASKILNSSGAITDRKNVVLIDDTGTVDEELISEAKRIIAGVGKGLE